MSSSDHFDGHFQREKFGSISGCWILVSILMISSLSGELCRCAYTLSGGAIFIYKWTLRFFTMRHQRNESSFGNTNHQRKRIIMQKLVQMVLLLALIAPTGAFAQKKGKPAGQPTPAAESSDSAHSEKHGHAKSLHDTFTGQGYGMAGCGLGSIVFGAKPGIIQVVAATLNAWGGQTFAITTGTSNCDIPEMAHQAAAFIETNREALRKDAARGEGATVVGLASLLKCNNSGIFGVKLQQNYEHIFSSQESYETTRRILETIRNDAELKPVCETLG
jgi:hypothetical protein